MIAHQGDAKVCNRSPTSYERIVGSSGSVRRDNGGHTLGLGICGAYASVPVRLLFPVCGTGFRHWSRAAVGQGLECKLLTYRGMRMSVGRTKCPEGAKV